MFFGQVYFFSYSIKIQYLFFIIQHFYLFVNLNISKNIKIIYNKLIAFIKKDLNNEF